ASQRRDLLERLPEGREQIADARLDTGHIRKDVLAIPIAPANERTQCFAVIGMLFELADGLKQGAHRLGANAHIPTLGFATAQSLKPPRHHGSPPAVLPRLSPDGAGEKRTAREAILAARIGL